MVLRRWRCFWKDAILNNHIVKDLQAIIAICSPFSLDLFAIINRCGALPQDLQAIIAGCSPFMLDLSAIIAVCVRSL